MLLIRRADLNCQITLLSHQGLDEEVQSRLLPKEFDINQYSFVGTIHRVRAHVGSLSVLMH